MPKRAGLINSTVLGMKLLFRIGSSGSRLSSGTEDPEKQIFVRSETLAAHVVLLHQAEFGYSK